MEFPNGDRYDGQFLNDSYHGNGSLAYGDARVYNGEFSHGVYERRGNPTLSNGTWQAGEWRDGGQLV